MNSADAAALIRSSCCFKPLTFCVPQVTQRPCGNERSSARFWRIVSMDGGRAIGVGIRKIHAKRIPYACFGIRSFINHGVSLICSIASSTWVPGLLLQFATV